MNLAANIDDDEDDDEDDVGVGIDDVDTVIIHHVHCNSLRHCDSIIW